jgi:hypothetical protein
MGIGAAYDFVKNLKNKMLDNKIHEMFKMNLLQDGVEYLSGILGKSEGLNLRSVSQFESRDFCFFIGLVFEGDPIETLKRILLENEIPYELGEPYGDRFVFRIDLENRIISSGSSHNFFFLDVYSKRESLYKIRISFHDPHQILKYQVVDKNYQDFTFWVFDEDNFKYYQISLNDVNLNYIERNKRKHKMDSTDGKYLMQIRLNDFGEMNFLELSKKKRRKN